MINSQELMWQRTTLLNDKTVQFATAKVYVFSDSVLCKERISPDPVKAWEGEGRRVPEFTSIQRSGSNRRRAGWSSSEKNFPGFTTLQILAEVQKYDD